MAIRINTKELISILEITPPEQNILLIGKHGIGKSQILTGYYTGRGLRVVALFLGQMSDPGDLIGLPDKNAESGKTEFMPPYWWPLDHQPVALFLDELNRARPELLQSVHDLALNRKLAGRSLPVGSVVVSAVNAGDEYQVTDLDPALTSRFNIYEFVPEADEWLAWARSKQLDGRVIDFIEANGGALDNIGVRGGASEDPIEKTPDRRAWVRVAELICPHEHLTPLLTKAISGVVGVPASVAFVKFTSTQKKVTPEQLLLHYDEAVMRELQAMSLQELIYLNRQLLGWIETQAAKLGPRRQTVLANLEQYLELLRISQRSELVADLITQVEKGSYTQASAMVLGAPRLMKIFQSYIERVKL